MEVDSLNENGNDTLNSVFPISSAFNFGSLRSAFGCPPLQFRPFHHTRQFIEICNGLLERSDRILLVGGCLVSRIALIVSEPAVARRKIISVANRVQRLSFLRNGISVSASRTELFPDDQSPQTTSWRSDRMLSRPYLGSWAIMSRCTW